MTDGLELFPKLTRMLHATRLQERELTAMTLITLPHLGRACFRVRLPISAVLRPQASAHTPRAAHLEASLSSPSPYCFPMCQRKCHRNRPTNIQIQ